MIWAVLIGNTRAVAALIEGPVIHRRQIVLTDSLRKIQPALAWAKRIRKLRGTQGIIVASVVPPVDPIIRRAVENHFGYQPLFVSSKSMLGIKIKVKKPSQVGADRLANAVAAKMIYGAPAIVVDYGTGTTFDVIDKSGAYCGGAILPGIGISLRALHDFTAKIPNIKFKRVRFAIGKTTEEAVRSGIYHGALGTTRELLFQIRKELGASAPSVATGGWCRVFEKSNLFQNIEPDLTLKGLSLIWQNHRA
ncbi:MAG TPA: type III pantothenate kinase [bacterium]|jgi:type III pantothenate kinase|nr:type III pantothenate kinase [bacterium]